MIQKKKNPKAQMRYRTLSTKKKKRRTRKLKSRSNGSLIGLQRDTFRGPVKLEEHERQR